MKNVWLRIVVVVGLLFACALLARGCPKPAEPPVRRPLPPLQMVEREPVRDAVPPLVAAMIVEPVSFVKAPPPPPEPVPEPPPVLIKSGWAYGAVKFMDEVPPRRKISRGLEGALSEEFVVDEEGGVQWSFVHVVKGLTQDPPEVPQETQELEIRDSRFIPHVVSAWI